jgi:hypothetical protein
MQSTVQGSVEKQRIFPEDLTKQTFSVDFRGNGYNIRGVSTAYGDVVVYGLETIQILTDKDERAATQYFYQLSQTHNKLNHNNLQIKDHFKVRCYQAQS